MPMISISISERHFYLGLQEIPSGDPIDEKPRLGRIIDRLSRFWNADEGPSGRGPIQQADNDHGQEHKACIESCLNNQRKDPEGRQCDRQ